MTPKSSRRILFFAAVVLPHVVCRAKVIPLASTLTATQGGRSTKTKDDENVSSKGKRMNMPKFWGRQSPEKDDTEVGKDDETSPGSKSKPDDGAGVNEDDGKPESDGKDEPYENENEPSPSPEGDTSDAVEKDGSSTTEQAAKDEEEVDDTKPADTQPTNQTKPGILYMNIAPPSGTMIPQGRPMPYPYMMPQHQQSPPPPGKNSPSLLSSLLSALFPRPQNLPVPSPYGPPMPPSSPHAPSGALLSLLLRLAIISLGTMVIDFFGLGSHSDAFLPTPAQHYTFERVNDRYRRDGSALRMALESPPPGCLKRRWKRIFGRRKRDVANNLILSEEPNVGDNNELVEPPSLHNGALYNRTVILIDMKPDSRVGNGMAEQLRDTVSFLIEQHRDHVDRRRSADAALHSKFLTRRFSKASYPHQRRTFKGIRPALGKELEIALFLDSPGGTVQDYGLASSHLSRLRNEPHVTLSVCVDRVAASGGYMMACQATPGHLFAAPFAMVGSIGVLMETVNVNEVLKRYGVKPLVIKAGKNKAPLKTLGEVTPEELQMAQDDADVIHSAFQQWVTESRPNVVASDDWMEKVCTGAVFLGTEAQKMGLVDRVLTSDEYVAERIAAGDRVLRLIPYRGPQFGLKLSPLDLLLSGLDVEGRANIRERLRGLGSQMIRCIAPLCRVGAAVSILNHLASVQSGSPGYSWAA